MQLRLGVIVQDDCGDWVTALCPYADRGCPDSDGDFDVVLPEPMYGTSGSGYKVRVADATDDSISDCSDEFYLMASEEAPQAGDEDGPSIAVTSPSEGDSAVPGEEYTVEVWRAVNMFPWCMGCTTLEVVP